MLFIQWILLGACVAILGAVLALLTAAGRLYQSGEIEEAGRRSRGLGMTAIVMGILTVPNTNGLAATLPGPRIFAAGVVAVALAGFVAGLGGLARKPVPSVWWAWGLLAAGAILVVASRGM